MVAGYMKILKGVIKPFFSETCSQCKKLFFYLTLFSQNFLVFYFFCYFIFKFVLLTRSKATEVLIHTASNYSDLLPEMARYCSPLVIFILLFWFIEIRLKFRTACQDNKQVKVPLSVFSKDTTEWRE